MLAVEGLRAGYGGAAVAGLDRLEVAPGRSALLLGPSGSGKTTLILAMAGLADAPAGAVRLDGEDLLALRPCARDRLRGRSIGLVFQDLHLVAGLSALDNLLLAPFAAGLVQDRARALALLEALDLAALARRPAERLSRGQAQRVAIARAMLLRPRLILADEPTASLDDAACEQVWALLTSAAREAGAPLVVATHDARLKARADQVVQVRALAGRGPA